jgi:molybdopterin/thiamine biosynthesis adenylyltransferase
MDPLSRIQELGYSNLEDYHLDAFSRNIGFLSRADMAILRNKRVAIPGLGGVGGIHLVTHIRTGFCNFNISDFDYFDVANANRQYGAKASNYKKPKLDMMINEALEINPFLNINTFPEGINEKNVDQFLDGVDILIDSLDVFVIDLRILLYKKAREKGIPVVTAAPLGFGTSVMCFSPKVGLSFEEHFGITKDLTENEKFARFIAGLSPKALHAKYVDKLSIQPLIKKVPSLGAGCQFAATAACAMSIKIILDRKGVNYAPSYFSVDPYLQTMKKGKVYGGFKNPIQKLKVVIVGKIIEKMRLNKDLTPEAPDLKCEGQYIPFKIMDYIIQAGIQAPSGENTQPWSFSVNGNTITVKINPKSDFSFFNINQRAALLSSGAVLENIKVAASVFGLSCDIKYNETNLEESLEVAQVHLKNTGAKRDALFRSIWERCTNRKQYSRKKLDAFVFEEINKITNEFPGAKLHILEDRTQLKRLKSALVKLGIARTENPLVHQFLNHHIRDTFKIAQAEKTGFALDNLEVGASGNFMLKATKNWKVMSFLNKFGFSKIVSTKVEEGIDNCGACILITMPNNSALNYVKGGQALERVWLKLAEMGISTQPMTTVNFFQVRNQLEGLKNFDTKHHQLLKDGFSEYAKIFSTEDMENRGQIMLLRLGYSKGIKTWTVRHFAKTLIEPASIKPELKSIAIENEKKHAVS